ncbi:MAG: hypothetical protein H7X80_00415 [bacterium]|nr:hypothetical protein [Candidatus Kapabacteria bacterium]
MNLPGVLSNYSNQQVYDTLDRIAAVTDETDMKVSGDEAAILYSLLGEQCIKGQVTDQQSTEDASLGFTCRVSGLDEKGKTMHSELADSLHK